MPFSTWTFNTSWDDSFGLYMKYLTHVLYIQNKSIAEKDTNLATIY